MKKMRFTSVMAFTGLFSSALFTPVAHGSIALTGFTETPLAFTATYSFTDNENLFPNIINTAGLYWKGGLIETFSPENPVVPASYSLTWTAWQIAAPHPGESPTGPMGADLCTFNAASSTAQPCSQTASLPHPISVSDGALHNDTFNFILNRDADGSGTITLTGSHVTASVSSIPAPSAVWLLGSGLVGLVGITWMRAGQTSQRQPSGA